MRLKSVLIIIVLILNVGFISAKSINYGLKFGINSSGVTNTPSNDRHKDLTAGVFWEYNHNKHESLRLELNYTENRFGITSYIRDYVDDYGAHYLAVDIDSDIKHIEAPLVLKFHPHYFNHLRPYVFTGLYYAYMVDGNSTWSHPYSETDANDRIDLEKSHWGFIIGCGFDMFIGGNLMSLDVRYNRGATQISEFRGYKDKKYTAVTISVSTGLTSLVDKMFR